MNIIGLIIFVLDVLAIVDCWKSGMEQGKKILWTVLILLVPLVGLILYYLVGKNSK